MTSDRPYRHAPGQSFAVRELGRYAGTQFDPAVVEALTRVLARAGEVGDVPVAPPARPPEAQRPLRAGRSPVLGGAAGITRGAGRRGRSFSSSSRSEASQLVVERAARRDIRVEVAEDEIGDVVAHWYDFYTPRASSES